MVFLELKYFEIMQTNIYIIKSINTGNFNITQLSDYDSIMIRIF